MPCIIVSLLIIAQGSYVGEEESCINADFDSASDAIATLQKGMVTHVSDTTILWAARTSGAINSDSPITLAPLPFL